MTWTPGRRTSTSGYSTYAGRVPEVPTWLRRHPWQADGRQGEYLAAVATVSVLLAATVVPRRRYPVAAFAVAIGGGPDAHRRAACRGHLPLRDRPAG